MPVSVQIAVAEKISTLAGAAVQEKVVDALFDREVNRRTEAMVQAIDLLSRQELDMRKLGPDVVTFNAEGGKESESYSKARIDERKKLGDQIAKLTNAINRALEKNDFGDVYNLVNKGKGE